jgi:hypothetical protein
MSEYQYYEFLAIDRPLSPQDLHALRAISSRATITPTHFSNFYTFGGGLKANPRDLLARYFDVFEKSDASAESPLHGSGVRRGGLRVPTEAERARRGSPGLPRH